MATGAGKDQFISWDGIDISNQFSNFSFSRSIDEAETTPFGATGETFETGLGDTMADGDGPWDGASGAIVRTVTPDFVQGNLKTLIYGPQGNTTGKVKYTFANTFIKSFGESSSVSDVVKYTIGFRINAKTRGVF